MHFTRWHFLSPIFHLFYVHVFETEDEVKNTDKPAR